MYLDGVNSGDPHSKVINYVDGSANSSGSGVSLEAAPLFQNNLAAFVTTHAYASYDDPNPPSITAGPNYTFGKDDTPAYNPTIDQLGTDPGSDNGQVAANALLRMEQSGGVTDETSEAQFVTQALAAHKNDPLFLQQYFGTLGVDRTAKILRYLTSMGHVQTPFNYAPGAANAKQVEKQDQDIADALSTLVKSKDFDQKDMDRLVSQFASDSPEQNFTFATDVLSKASPAVNQMFYQSAKTYALQHADSTAGQAMAAYAMQALSQSSNPLAELESMPKGQLSTLVSAAMKGEASYGNPPTLQEFAKSGVYRAQNGQGAPLDGLSHLMFDAAYADTGDRFAPAPLSTDQAHDLQSRLFQASIGTLQSDPSVKSFYSQSVPMKDALAADFQSGYDSIVKAKAYSGPNGELSSNGMQAFREFFSDALFSPPPSSNALGTAQFFQGKLNSFITDANKLPAGATASVAQLQQARLMGEQAEAMAAGLKESLTSILAGSTQADNNSQAMVNLLITGGEAGVGALGPIPAVGSAIVGEALKLLVASGSDQSVPDAIRDLKNHGIDVTGYTSGNLQNESEDIQNFYLSQAFQTGMHNSDGVFEQPVG